MKLKKSDLRSEKRKKAQNFMKFQIEKTIRSITIKTTSNNSANGAFTSSSIPDKLNIEGNINLDRSPKYTKTRGK